VAVVGDRGGSGGDLTELAEVSGSRVAVVEPERRGVVRRIAELYAVAAGAELVADRGSGSRRCTRSRPAPSSRWSPIAAPDLMVVAELVAPVDHRARGVAQLDLHNHLDRGRAVRCPSSASGSPHIDVVRLGCARTAVTRPTTSWTMTR